MHQRRELGNQDFKFLTKVDYVNELISRLDQADQGDRFCVCTHILEVTEELVAALLIALAKASQRGATVSLALDARTLPIIPFAPQLRATERSLQALKRSGVTYAILNKTWHRPFSPLAGRSHIKLAILNDDIYIGGCNLEKMNHLDMMVQWSDKRAADWLYDLMQAAIRHRSTQIAFGKQDRQLKLDNHTALLLDAGQPNQSIILDYALELIDNAKEWLVLACQYFPNQVTIERLAKAHRRGVKATIYFNHPSNHSFGYNFLHHFVLSYERTRQPAALLAHQLPKNLPLMHAKLLATEQAAMIGSHNYVHAGVQLGTAELTLLRRDPVFTIRAVKFLRQQLKEADLGHSLRI